MSNEGMPPLPKPLAVGVWGYTEPTTYTKDQMLAYGRLVAQECIGICKDQACGGSAFNNAAEHISQAISKRFGLEA